MKEKILVIQSGTLGDFVRSLGAMEKIRGFHPEAHITLLTAPRFIDLAQQSRYFNEVVVQRRGYLFFNRRRFTQVYDLQRNSIAADPPDLSWLQSDIGLFALKKPYVLLMPGASCLEKRWPAVRFGALGLMLIRAGYQAVLVGTKEDADVLARVVKSCPGIIDLSARTSLNDIAMLARGAAAAIGNDTGPTHLAALAGCRTVALVCLKISTSAPTSAQVIAADDLEDISVTDVYKNLFPEGV